MLHPKKRKKLKIEDEEGREGGGCKKMKIIKFNRKWDN